MMRLSSAWPLWQQAWSQRKVWRRSLSIGLTVGAAQILVNQGDFWWRGQIDSVVIVKTLVTPMIAISVALYSAAGTYVQMKADRLTTDAQEVLK